MMNRYFFVILLSATAFAETKDKPSPVHYKSSTTPVRSSGQSKVPAPMTALAQDASRNRVPGSGEPSQMAMVDGVQSGIACFYGKPVETDPANPHPQQPDQELAAAHATLPLGSQVQVTNLVNGKSVKVKVTDRISPDGDRIISVNRHAAERLGFLGAGTTRVKLELVKEGSRI